MAHALAQTVQQFVAARVILAAGESVSTPAGLKAAATYLPVKQRSIAIGLINTAPNIGAILTPLLIPPFALAFGWQAAFWVTGALGFVWLAGWWWGTRNLKPLGDIPERARVPWGTLLADRKTWTVIGAKFCIDAVWWFVLFWMPDFFNRQFGLSQGELGWPIAIIFTLAALGAITSGGLYPILLSRGMSVNGARKTSMRFDALVVLAMPLSLQTGNPWIAAVLIGLGLFAHQGFSTNVFGMTADIIPATRVASVIALGAVAGILVAPITFTSWDVGVMLGLKGFAAAILGGMGSGPGAVLGGLALGILEAMGAGYLSSAYKDAIAFVLILVVLFFLPNGLLGKRSTERV